MTNILAIESSGLVASVAYVNEEKMIAEFTLNLKLTHSETLLPLIDELVKRTGIDLKEISAIAVSNGPGSFTGLRIGAATAKGLGFALNCPIVPVPTTETIASNIFAFDGNIVPLMDARRNQVYTGVYRNSGDGFETIYGQMAVPIGDIIDIVNRQNERVIFLGDGVSVFKDTLEKDVKVSHQYAPVNNNVQRAGSLAVRALALFKEGKWVKADDLTPEYLRLSQAERERNENS